ncbi:MAG: 30S ribosomal protein S19 [Candidatus Pacebacteria bacterium]|nr:30S ribosomal protein S19 [Candidatus Paceibacterota bacterium]
MPRSLKKGPFVDPSLIKKIQNTKPDSREVIKTWKRACTITPEMIGFTFGVYNGKSFISVKVSEEMVGHRLGEFSPTTKFSRHGGRMQRELEAKEAAKETAKIEEVKQVETKPAAKK